MASTPLRRAVRTLMSAPPMRPKQWHSGCRPARIAAPTAPVKAASRNSDAHEGDDGRGRNHEQQRDDQLDGREKGSDQGLEPRGHDSEAGDGLAGAITVGQLGDAADGEDARQRDRAKQRDSGHGCSPPGRPVRLLGTGRACDRA